MTPTLIGRLQTRIFALATAGGLWTLVITPLLPGMDPLSVAYRMTFVVLALVLLLGLGWELLYHVLQQFRWEKDWPQLFGLVTGINEGLLTWFVLRGLGLEVPGWAFLVHFTTTWVLVWVFVNGPMRVLFIRWRFSGGRLR